MGEDVLPGSHKVVEDHRVGRVLLAVVVVVENSGETLDGIHIRADANHLAGNVGGTGHPLAVLAVEVYAILMQPSQAVIPLVRNLSGRFGRRCCGIAGSLLLSEQDVAEG